jgi:hypothetical protein
MDAISNNAVNLGSLLSNVKAPLKRYSSQRCQSSF